MKFIVRLFCLISILFIIQACSSKTEQAVSDSEHALVTVNGKTLYLEELKNTIPGGLNPTDSTLAAEAYIKMWVKNELVYEKALENLSDKKTIEELVNNYRQTLTIYSYQEQLVKERLEKDISEDELKSYYDANASQFRLESDIIKGLFLKIPLTSPKINDVKKWYRQFDNKSIGNVEKYSLQYAANYDYFYDRWVDFDDVLVNIPRKIDNIQQFLASNKYLEVQDSAFIYLLNIKEYMSAGKDAPFEFVKGEVLDILINQKKDEFIRKVEEDLYKTAVDKGQIKYYN